MLNSVGHKTLTIELIKAPTRKNKRHLPTLIGLGLRRKLHRRVTLKDTPEVRGMICKVGHMVRLIEWDGWETKHQLGAFASEERLRNDVSFNRKNHIENDGLTRSEENRDPDRFSGLENSDEIAAIKFTSAALSSAKEASAKSIGTSSKTRSDLAMATRSLYNLMFSNDMIKAGHAAYALVSNSRSYGKGLDPRADFDSLSSEEAVRFRDGVREMLKKHRINFITSLSANKVSVTDGDATIEVRLRISKSLAFNIKGEKVIVGTKEPTHLSKEDLFITCPLAKAPPTLSVYDGNGIDVVLDATAKFVMDENKIKGEVPILVTAPDLREYRKIHVGRGDRN